MNTFSPINILLADDDQDDRFFFARALEEIQIPTKLTALCDGEKLMECLAKNIDKLPDVLFLDLNMPRKNGSECLMEIKTNRKLKKLPIVIYSTSFHKDIINLFYKHGALYCAKKPCCMDELKKIITHVLSELVQKKHAQPPKEKFILGMH